MGLLGRLKDWMADEAEEPRPHRAMESAAPEPAVNAGCGKVVLVSPEHYVDAGKLADYLCKGYTLLLNLEHATGDTARRMVDFLSGSAYARDGQLLQIAGRAYLLAPSEVEVLDANAKQPEEDGWLCGDAFGL